MYTDAPEAVDLFARAQAGDESAWRELFDRSYTKLRRVIGRRLSPPMRSRFDSTDFANDVFGSLVAKIHRFDFPSMAAFEAFLYQAADQKVNDEYRKMSTAKRDYTLEIPLDGLTRAEEGHGRSLASDDPTPSQVAVANESFDNLRSGLDSEAAKALDMAREGRTTIEIAGTLGMNVRKVQRMLKSAYESWALRGGVRP